MPECKDYQDSLHKIHVEKRAELKKLLDTTPMLQEERDMWYDLGFYIGGPDPNGSYHPSLVAPNGTKIAVAVTVLSPIRDYLIWVHENRHLLQKPGAEKAGHHPNDAVTEINARE